MLAFLGRWLRSLLVTVATLALAAALYIAWQLSRPEQRDDAVHLARKAEYLRELGSYSLPASAPNILFLLYDDLGYGDIGAGAPADKPIDTPNLDRLAAAGVSFTDFHSPSPVCTPARAGYLTGRLAPRAGLPNVVFPSGGWKGMLSRITAPGGATRLPAEEITIADTLAAAGYRTGMVGKWHLGDVSPSLPNDMGFESFYGALYSNDMEPFAWYRNRAIDTPAPADQERMTEVYTREAIDFMRADPARPFFLYFAHNFPHDPLHVRPERLGGSDAGIYGDVMEEIDAGVGEIIAWLEQSGRLDNTLILVSSDNGPWFSGSPGALRGRKGSTFEGGMRVPFIAHWPAGLAGGRVESGMAMGTDLLPTLLELLGLPAPADRVLDGRSILPLLTGSGASPHQYLYHYDGERLFAVRGPRFKYRAPALLHYGTDQMPFAPGIPQQEWLFDLRADPQESYSVAARHPQALEQLREALARKQAEMAGNPRGWH